MQQAQPKTLQGLSIAIRARNYSYRTEQAYVMWIKQYIRFHNITHPEDMAEPHVIKFHNHLTIDKNVAPNTQNQALNALNALDFLYTHVPFQPLDKLQGIARS